jgi:3-deoxy-D-manno-octulosonic-acid transferase
LARWIYTLCYALLLPVLFGRLWWRGRGNPDYRLRWAERMGWYKTLPLNTTSVVFHAVSVGEVHAALSLIERFLQQHPMQPVIVTTTTPTGSARVQQLLGQRVQHVYLPYDLPGCINRFLAQFQPAMVVLMETELWPNLLHACAQRQCKTMLINARLSPKSLRSYRRVGSLTKQMLHQLTMLAAQASADGERFVQLGLPATTLHITGSLKFDISINATKVAQARTVKASWQGRPVWIAASTREGEDALVLQALQQVLRQLPDALLVLVPRHIERFALAAELAHAAGFATVNQSSGASVEPTTQVLVGDTLGDMHFYYSLADVAFVGGSLVPTGCQNIIEAAALGLPTITGPSLFNFQAASEVLCAAGAMEVVPDVNGLAVSVVTLLRDQELQQRRAAQALAVVAENVGATERTLALIAQVIKKQSCSPALSNTNA